MAIVSSSGAFQLDRAEPTSVASPGYGKTQRGSLLRHRARRSPAELRVLPAAKEQWVVVCYGGHEYVSTSEMAECFLGKARLALDSHVSELVPLLHKGGLELLFIAENTPFTVGSKFEYRPYPRN